MIRKFASIFTAVVMVFCLFSGNFAGLIAVADDEMTIPSKGGTLSAGTYKLTSNVTVSERLIINSDVEVTIDLNGYSIEGKTDGIILLYGTLNLMDSSDEGTGCITNNLTTVQGYGIKMSSGGTLNMSGGTVKGTYGISCTNSSSDTYINIYGGTIIATKYTAIYGRYGSITISGTDKVVISAQKENQSDAYGIRPNSASLTISNPNAYVSGTKGAIYEGAKSNGITAGHYSSDVSNYVNTDVYSCNETDDSDYPYVVTANNVTLPSLYGETLILDGSTGVTFYFDMTGVSGPTAYSLKAKIGDDGEEQSISAGETRIIDGIEYYRYTVYVNPSQFSTTISAYLTDGTNTTAKYEYSVYEYCMFVIDYDLYEAADLCKAILNYGDYASEYCYNDSTDSLASVSGWTDPVTEEWTADLSKYAVEQTEGTAKCLILGSKIAIRIYLTSDVADENDVFSVNGETLELYEVDDADYADYAYYIEYEVDANDMVKIFTFMKNDEAFTTYSVLTYVKNMVGSEADGTALSNLCKAIYFYSVEANKFTGWI